MLKTLKKVGCIPHVPLAQKLFRTDTKTVPKAKELGLSINV